LEISDEPDIKAHSQERHVAPVFPAGVDFLDSGSFRPIDNYSLLALFAFNGAVEFSQNDRL
jgi:hypothetical protein